MFTQCPECGSIFRLKATQLRQAHGHVRCSGCGGRFDALRFLTDDTPKLQLEQTAEPAIMDDVIHINSDEQADNDDSLPSIRTDHGPPHGTERPAQGNQPFIGGLDEIEDEPAPDAANQPGASVVESVVVPTHEVTTTANVTSTADAMPIPAATPPPANAPLAAAPASAINQTTRHTSGHTSGHTPSQANQARTIRVAPVETANRSRHVGLWFLLLLGSAIALAWWQRQWLASQPTLAPLAAQVCQWVDCQQPLARSLVAYEVKGLELSINPQDQGQLLITGSLTNAATFAQPLPHLRISITADASEPPVTTVFSPSGYLQATASDHVAGAGDQLLILAKLPNPITAQNRLNPRRNKPAAQPDYQAQLYWP